MTFMLVGTEDKQEKLVMHILLRWALVMKLNMEIATLIYIRNRYVHPSH